MSDQAKIQVGKPFSTSRKWEKAMKKKTHKVRRRQGKNDARQLELIARPNIGDYQD